MVTTGSRIMGASCSTFHTCLKPAMLSILLAMGRLCSFHAPGSLQATKIDARQRAPQFSLGKALEVNNIECGTVCVYPDRSKYGKFGAYSFSHVVGHEKACPVWTKYGGYLCVPLKKLPHWLDATKEKESCLGVGHLPMLWKAGAVSV